MHALRAGHCCHTLRAGTQRFRVLTAVTARRIPDSATYAQERAASARSIACIGATFPVYSLNWAAA